MEQAMTKKKQVFEPLINGPTWREIIAEALGEIGPGIAGAWDRERTLAMADCILAAMRRSYRPDPLDLEVVRLRAALEWCGVPGAGR
jgi:hypothetical protein